jgi:hypothetical protein
MIVQFETERTMLPTGSAAGWRGPIITAALVASVALILSACSSQSVPAASATARYPDLNDPPPSARQVRADQVAQIKAELIQLRVDQLRASAQQQAALH